MNIPLVERRQIENEMIFRRANEEVADKLVEVDVDHIADGNPQLTRSDDLILHFWCECSDENCDARIPLKLTDYQKIHQNRKAFVIKPNHQVNAIEEVILTKSTYSVVEKNNSTPEPGSTLNATPINN